MNMRKEMNNFVSGVLLSSLVLFSFSVAHAAQDPRDVVAAYFQAMKNGDIVAMKSYIGGKLYNKRKILLEQNVNYPDFLRKYYADGDIQVGEAQDGVVKVLVQFPDGSIHTYQLVVEQAPDGDWRITDEISRGR
jgi:hypothetical protein